MARLLFNDNLISAKMPRSNGETLAWYEDCLLNGKVSEEKIKQESIKFFQLTTKESAKSKQIFKKDIQQFVTKHVNMQKCLTREYLGAHGGHGKHQENPPEEFERDIDDEKKRRLAFLKFGREGMKSSQKYKAWLEQDCQLFVKTNELSEKDVDKEVEIIPKEKTNEIHLTRERSSGKNIFDAEKIIISKQQDGTMKKSVIKETYARITLRKRHQDNENDPLTGAGELKRAKAVDDILNHTSEHDKKTKAGLVAKIIDKEGAHFSQDVFQKSKMMQQTRKLNAAQTTSMMSEVRSSDYLFRELRTGLIKEIGFSPFASQKEVDTYRKKVLVAKKDDWDFRRLKLYQHKLGNKKSLPTETPETAG